MEPDILERIFDGSIQPRDVKLSALESITENFSKERIIGEGRFGIVYKGVLRNGEVAVKRIRNNQTIDEKLFRREVNNLLKANHKNIVRFLGFCSHTEHKAIQYEGEFIYAEDRERLLCFEYINNGSLEIYITDELRGLAWDTRYSIIKGICEGLQYLHMKRNFIHMDLKPANILIDNSMVAKITDFGLARTVENTETKSTDRFSSQGYRAPEYIDSGVMTVKNDVYSLGIIIIELVTGHRSIPDSNNVLRRWKHRWHKSGKETPFRYEQIAKLIEIGLQCQEKDPYKRPFLSDIISVINRLESTHTKISNANESPVGQISPYREDDMLGIEPLELLFPIELNTQISCSLELTNETNGFFAFNIQTTSPLPYTIQPNKDIVAPRSKYRVNIILQPLDHTPQDRQYTGDFIVRSTKVSESLISEDITEDIFNREDGKLVDEVYLMITYKSEVPQVDVTLESLLISDMRNLKISQESSGSPTEAESKIGESTSDEVIRFDPPELSFPLVPGKTVLSSVKIINVTEFYVCVRSTYADRNTGIYSTKDLGTVLPPRSTYWFTVERKEKKDAVEDMQFNEVIKVWYAIVAEDIKKSDLADEDFSEWKILPVVLTEANSEGTSDGSTMPGYQFFKDATDNFSNQQKLGSGQFGEVYKAQLSTGKLVAIKVLYQGNGLDDEILSRECTNLMSFRHKNIVRLLGYSSEKQEELVLLNGRVISVTNAHRIIAFEYVPGGNLSTFLSDQNLGLSWDIRFKIIKGVCEGLQYLHEDAGIMHFHLKPENILLDDEKAPKIADFGFREMSSAMDIIPSNTRANTSTCDHNT